MVWTRLKGCGMGLWLVLVSPCFRKNVVATCKIGSFLCSLDNLLQKNVIVLFFGNQILKWRSFEKRAIFDPLFTFFSHQGKVTKIPSTHISLTYIHVFCSPYWLLAMVWTRLLLQHLHSQVYFVHGEHVDKLHCLASKIWTLSDDTNYTKFRSIRQKALTLFDKTSTPFWKKLL